MPQGRFGQRIGVVAKGSTSLYGSVCIHDEDFLALPSLMTKEVRKSPAVSVSPVQCANPITNEKHIKLDPDRTPKSSKLLSKQHFKIRKLTKASRAAQCKGKQEVGQDVKGKEVVC